MWGDGCDGCWGPPSHPSCSRPRAGGHTRPGKFNTPVTVIYGGGHCGGRRTAPDDRCAAARTETTGDGGDPAATSTSATATPSCPSPMTSDRLKSACALTLRAGTTRACQAAARNATHERRGDAVTDTESALRSGEAARTLLERRIRERKQTFEEFVSFAETFARESGEVGTLSVRHLQRLVTGRSQASRVRPATARLLERIFDDDIARLLSAPDVRGPETSQPFDSPSAVGAHALCVAVAVVVKEAQVLVVSRRDGAAHPQWQFPAGMVKPGAASPAVAVTETLAETGVHCVHVRQLGRRLHPVTQVYCEYQLCEYICGVAVNLDAAENLAVTWVDKSSLTRLITPSLIYPPVLEELSLGATNVLVGISI